MNTRGDYDLALTGRRLVERLFRALGAHQWESLDNIFIDSKIMEKYLRNLQLEDERCVDSCIYYEWCERGLTTIYTYNPLITIFPPENLLKIYWVDEYTIRVERVS